MLFACVRAAKPALPPQRSADYQAPIARAPLGVRRSLRFCALKTAFQSAREGWGLAASAARHAPPAAVRKPGYRPASSLFVGGCGRAVGRPGLFLFPCLPCGLGCVRQAVSGLPAPLLSWHGGRAKAALSALFPLACAAFCNAVCAWAQTHEEKNACFPLTPRRLRRFARCLSRWLALLRLHRRTPKPGK